MSLSTLNFFRQLFFERGFEKQHILARDDTSEAVRLNERVGHLERVIITKNQRVEKLEKNLTYLKGCLEGNRQEIADHNNNIQELKKRVVRLGEFLARKSTCLKCEQLEEKICSLKRLIDLQSIELEIWRMQNVEVMQVQVTGQIKFLFLTDIQGRNCGDIFETTLEPELFYVRCSYKLDSVLEEMIASTVDLSQGFSHQDYIVIFGGIVNGLQSQIISRHFLETLRDAFNHTNLIFVLTPYWYNIEPYNSYIQENNDTILSVFNDRAIILDSNQFLRLSDFSRYGLHLNHSGYNEIVHQVCNYISNHIASN